MKLHSGIYFIFVCLLKKLITGSLCLRLKVVHFEETEEIICPLLLSVL